MQRYLSKLKNKNSIHPVSNIFGLDRGEAIDRYYIEKFLFENQHFIKGVVLEIGDSRYTNKFGGSKVKKPLILNNTKKKDVNIIGNLETGKGLPENMIDCFILTQTLLCIYDVQSAARNAIKVLKPGGVLLLTVPGITQISRFDYERWGQYWSFTDQSIKKLFEQVVNPNNIVVNTYGNVKSATAFLRGLALHEISKKDLDYSDINYQMIISGVVKK